MYTIDNNLLNNEEIEKIYTMVESLTGNCQSENYRKEIIVSNVLRRIRFLKLKSIEDYLQFSLKDEKEYAHLLNSFTIHTTEWFREINHFNKFEILLQEKFKDTKKFRILCGGCSSGEEAYSFALVLEAFRNKNEKFDYEYKAFDIDPISIELAKKALYPLKDFYRIPQLYQIYLKKFDKDNLFSIDSNIISRGLFFVENLMNMKYVASSYELVVCRNVLIYFAPEKVKEIISKLVSCIVKGGILIIGHSDNLESSEFQLKYLKNSMFEKI